MLWAFAFPGRSLRSLLLAQATAAFKKWASVGHYWEQGGEPTPGRRDRVLVSVVWAWLWKLSIVPPAKHPTLPALDSAELQAELWHPAKLRAFQLGSSLSSHSTWCQHILRWSRAGAEAAHSARVLFSLLFQVGKKPEIIRVGEAGLLLISSGFFSPAQSQGVQTKEIFAVLALEAAVFEVLLFICKGWLVYGKTAQKQSLE